MRTKNLCIIMAGGALSGCLACGARSTQSHVESASAQRAATTTNTPQAVEPKVNEAELSARLKAIAERAGGAVGVAVTHVETGRALEVGGGTQQPLFSVFKLPLAIAVLKEAEEGRLRLDQKVRVTPEEVAPGFKGNSDLWREPVERTVTELIELSIARSDNTSSDKLLEMVGGPEAVTRRMRDLGLRSIEIKASVREFAAARRGVHPNTGTASDITQLLARIQKGEVLQPPQTELLLGIMGRATTGLRRLRGELPAGTPVADKTGTGEGGTVINDVGLITLPEGRGHLAMAVLLNGSKLPEAAQEKIIAELARAAYDAHVAAPATEKR